MRVSDFKISYSGKTARVSADFSFTTTYGTFLQQLFFYTRAVIQFLFRPANGLAITQTVWFDVPANTFSITHHQDGFFLLALPLALFLEEDLEFEGQVSPQLLKKIGKLKKYFDYGRGISKRNYPIIAQENKARKKTQNLIAQFFSLGVDSFHTLLCAKNTLKQRPQHLIYVDGYDVPHQKKAFLKKLHRRIGKVARATNTKPLFLASNIRHISDPIIGWGFYHVTALAAAGHLMGFKKTYINGESFEWPDWGLRKGADTLFSTSHQKFELVAHNLTRDIKIKQLKKSPLFELFLQHVRVCWLNVIQKNIPYNCSECQKCLKTKLTLLAFDVKKTPTFASVKLNKLAETWLPAHVREEWQILYELLAEKNNISPKILSTIKQAQANSTVTMIATSGLRNKVAHLVSALFA